jgi:hypothetical protein
MTPLIYATRNLLADLLDATGAVFQAFATWFHALAEALEARFERERAFAGTD